MEITKDILYVGVNDHLVDLFEGQYDVPNGMAYNSYLICDDKVAVMDSVDAHFTDEWITKIAAALGERTPDYLVVQHMEPDHSGSVAAFAQAYPGTTIVASAQAFNMMKAYFGTDYADRRVVVKEGDTLPLGTHTLHFVTAPMVHWPEVIMTYDDADKVLFSADAFGKFGALDVEEPWLPEARRYFIGIVGKYGVQVQAVLKKAAALDIETVCSLHGPVLHKEQLGDVLAAYDAWSAYRPETEGVLVAYSSIYGHTAEAANRLAEALREKGVETVAMDLARCDMAEAVAQAFRFSKLVLATPTYNADVFPFMKEFIHHLTERNYQNRTVAFIENGSWAPMAAKHMRAVLDTMKNMQTLDRQVTIRSAMNTKNREELERALDVAASYDRRILVEVGVVHPVEINCAAVGYGEDVRASVCEMPVPSSNDTFLDFWQKYLRNASTKGEDSRGMKSLSRVVPAPIGDELTGRIQTMTCDIFKLLDCCGTVRVDFILDQNDMLFVNEPNTIPGSLAFYLWKASGLDFPKLIEKMVEDALRAHADKNSSVFAYDSSILKKVAAGTKGSKR